MHELQYCTQIHEHLGAHKDMQQHSHEVQMMMSRQWVHAALLLMEEWRQ